MESWEQKVLLKFSPDPKDFWTVDDSVKGTSVIGGTGSGKTSGSGKAIALKFLQQGWGGLVLCAKTDEAQLWQQYCKQSGRENDLIIFGKNSVRAGGENEGKTIVFNPLHYEMTREGEGAGDVFNITNIFINLYKMGSRATNDGEPRKEDRFWDNALKRIISRTVELINLAGEELTYKNMIEVIYTAPTEKRPYVHNQFLNFTQMVKYEEGWADTESSEDTEEEKNDKATFKQNYFLKCLAKAFNNIAHEDEHSANCYTFNTILRYFSSSLPYMSEHTQNAVIESFMGIVEPFLSGILYTHFSGETNLYPEEIYTKNKIIVLDFPVKEFLDAGIMAQGIFKLIFQQAVERRDVSKYPTPAFLWADEAQYFINPYDQIFLTTARSSRTAVVMLSQSISNYFAVMGSGYDARAKVDSLMGNLSTKIFHANSDAETNEYASRLIGKAVTTLKNTGASHQLLSLSVQTSENHTQQYLPQIQPREFTTLKSGGIINNYEVDAVVFVTGKTWSTKENFIKPIFEQSFSK